MPTGNSNYNQEQIKAWQNSDAYKALGEKFLANINSGNSSANNNIQSEADAAMAKMFAPQQSSYVNNLNKYLGAAQDEYNPIYNAKVTALQNALNQNTLALDQQKYGVNSNFNTQVGNQNRQNAYAQNNFSNQTLNRGLGRSSVAVTGLAEMDMTNNRQIGEINQSRANALSSIEAQKAQELNNYNNTLLQMEGDKQSSINSLARQIEGEQDSRDFRNKQWDYQVGRDTIGDNRYNEDKRTDAQRYIDSINYRDSQDKVEANKYKDSIDYRNSRDKISDVRYDQGIKTDNSRYADTINYRNKQDAISTQRYNNDYALKIKSAQAKQKESEGYTEDDFKKMTWDDFYRKVDNGEDLNYLKTNRSDIIKAIGPEEYAKMLKMSNDMDETVRENKRLEAERLKAYYNARQNNIALNNRRSNASMD